MVRGTATGLEIVIDGASFDDAWRAVAERLAERPDFYRGSKATVFVGVPPLGPGALAAALASLAACGIELRGIYGDAETEAASLACAAPYLGPSPRGEAPRLALFERATREAEPVALTSAARSLDADFAGARADFVKRRERIVAARDRMPAVASTAASPRGPAVAPSVLPAGPATLYHRGHLRGGQSLQHAGTIVVFGDVNPGAELTASGDIMVFGALRGTAHAGAQGDTGARVIALDLQPTQLRIATAIAAGAGDTRRPKGGLRPEVAFVDGDRSAPRIAIAAYDDARVPR